MGSFGPHDALQTYDRCPCQKRTIRAFDEQGGRIGYGAPSARKWEKLAYRSFANVRERQTPGLRNTRSFQASSSDPIGADPRIVSVRLHFGPTSYKGDSNFRTSRRRTTSTSGMTRA